MALETEPLNTIPVAEPYGPPASEVRVGTLVSRVFLVWGQNVWRFLGFTAVAFLPIVLAGAGAGVFLPRVARSGGPSTAALTTLLVIFVPLAVLGGLVWSGGITYGTIQTLAGRPVRFGTMFSVGFRRSPKVLGAWLVAGLVILVGLALLVVPGIVLSCGYAAVLGVAVIERLGPVEALKRSWNLTDGYKGTIFGTGVVMALIGLAVALVGQLLQLIPILGLLVGLFLNLTVNTLGAIWPAVVYHDLRVAREGAATDDLARVFE